MKRHSYGKLISMSWDWMIQMLFRPFSLKKWIMLAVILFLAGQMGGGFNINLRENRTDFDKIIDAIRQKAPAKNEVQTLPPTSLIPARPEGLAEPLDIAPQTDITFKKPLFFKDPKTVAIAAVIASVFLLFVGIFILLWIWIGSNFSFVFIDSMVRNDASLRIPFHRNKAQGNSYFKWNIVFTSIALLAFGVIIALPIVQLAKAGVFSAKPPVDIVKILSILLPYVPILIISGLLFFLVAFFTREFVLPIMYKRKIGILKAWGVFLRLLKGNIGEILLFSLVRLGLSLIALIAVIILTIIGILALILIGGILVLIGWLIYSVTPAAAKLIVMAFLAMVGMSLLVLLMLLFTLIFIPIPIFLRIFSIYVIGSTDESLDLFAPKSPEELAAEADAEKYKKSMALVWFAVLVPAIVAVIGILLAIAIPGFMKARQRALRPEQFGVEQIPFKEPSGISDFAVQKAQTPRNTVTVYLKNGNSFEAELVSESESNIAFRVEGGTFILPRSDILRIERNP